MPTRIADPGRASAVPVEMGGKWIAWSLLPGKRRSDLLTSGPDSIRMSPFSPAAIGFDMAAGQ